MSEKYSSPNMVNTSPRLPSYSSPPLVPRPLTKDTQVMPQALPVQPVPLQITGQPGTQQQPQIAYVIAAPMPQPTMQDAGAQYRNEMYARCARGDHVSVTTYGPCGIIASILLFPIGLIALIFDSKRRCERCGVTLGRSNAGC